MSSDILLAHPCPHLISGEKAVLSSDRRTVITRQNLSGMGLVSVTLNDDVTVPHVGYYDFAELTGTVKEPFKIDPHYNTLTVSSSIGSASYSLPTGYVYARQLLAILQRTGIEITSSGGKLRFKDVNRVGSNSFVNLSGLSLTALGFQYQQGVRGQMLTPPWTLGRTTDGYVIEFSQPLRNNPYLRVTYPVPREKCLRCRGTGVENDYRFDSTGDVLMVSNENLLYQASLKDLLTKRGSNPYHPWYGSLIQSFVGSKALSGSSEAVKLTIMDTLEKFRKMQTEQAKYQDVSPEERLASVTSVDVSAVEDDPTAFLADVAIRNFSNNDIQLTIVFTVPGVSALAGTNGLSLG